MDTLRCNPWDLLICVVPATLRMQHKVKGCGLGYLWYSLALVSQGVIILWKWMCVSFSPNWTVEKQSVISLSSYHHVHDHHDHHYCHGHHHTITTITLSPSLPPPSSYHHHHHYYHHHHHNHHHHTIITIITIMAAAVVTDKALCVLLSEYLI